MMMRTLIFNADDYGLSPGVSRGIREAAAGVVQSTTVMANLVTVADAEALSATSLNTGIHLNLSAGRPLSSDYPAPLLNADGTFNKALALADATWRLEDNRSAAWREWQAQLARLSALGLTLRHIDSHHHTHLLDSLFGYALELAVQTGLGLRVRGQLAPRTQAAGVRCPDELIESFFGINNIERAQLMSTLRQTEGQTVEVMCHPGYGDEQLADRSGYTSEREQELAVLRDPEFRAELEEQGWVICGYNWL